MLLGPTQLVLCGLSSFLCLLVCQCNGAPPRKAGQNLVTGTKYTDEEDMFIVQELSNHLDGVVEAYSSSLWDKIQKNHLEKWLADTPGFPQERTSTSLRDRFRKVLMRNHPQNNVKVPEIVLRKMKAARECRKRRGKDRRIWYSQQENDFIFKELLKPSYTTLTGIQALGPIIEKHNRKRLAKTLGFENERNAAGLRTHLFHLKSTGQLPKEVADKFLKTQNVRQHVMAAPQLRGPGDATGSTSRSKETNLQRDNEEGGPWIDEWIEELHDDSAFEIINKEK